MPLQVGHATYTKLEQENVFNLLHSLAIRRPLSLLTVMLERAPAPGMPAHYACYLGLFTAMTVPVAVLRLLANLTSYTSLSVVVRFFVRIRNKYHHPAHVHTVPQPANELDFSSA